jgi:asparagine synthase (glutamine-hydrolysing)
MCGIFGVIRLDRQPASGFADHVEKAVHHLHHRGPDASGVIANGSVCLGHARLSIIDLSGGAQPMWSDDGQGLISYNGEVYNFQELSKQLTRRGRRFRTRSDTEVVLNAYLEWGEDCVQYLRGMFAFAAVDFNNNTAFLTRDRLGIKPLFYTVLEDALVFSSELEAIYQSFGPFRIDLEALDDYLYWQYIHAPRTIYRDVRQLPPGHSVVVNLLDGMYSERRYWKLHFQEDRSISLEEWGERLDSVIRESVEIRLVSDVPFGAFLSGGIDSSLVVGYMADILEQPVRTFSIGFKEADYSELKYAEAVAAINQTDHHTEIVEAESVSLLPLLVRHYGQPFADSSAIPTYHVSRMARKHVKMVLSGDGGDENFAGYNSYETVIRTVSPGRRERTRSLRARIQKAISHFGQKWLRLSNSLLDRAYEIHCQTAHHFSPAERKRLFRRGYKDLVREHLPHRRALMDIGKEPLISRLQHLDLMAYLPFDILTKVDIASMANSLEVRVPLLDHILVETAATIPAEFKFRTNQFSDQDVYEKKFILKQLARRRYPLETFDRPKMGFGIPLGNWFAGKLNGEVRRRLLDSEFLPLLLDREEIANLVNLHSHQIDISTKLWNLLFLEEWMRSHAAALEGA